MFLCVLLSCSRAQQAGSRAPSVTNHQVHKVVEPCSSITWGLYIDKAFGQVEHGQRLTHGEKSRLENKSCQGCWVFFHLVFSMAECTPLALRFIASNKLKSDMEESQRPSETKTKDLHFKSGIVPRRMKFAFSHLTSVSLFPAVYLSTVSLNASVPLRRYPSKTRWTSLPQQTNDSDWAPRRKA